MDANKGIKNPNYSHGMSNTSIYRRWSRMKTCCNNPHAANYKHYGKRGIAIYPIWEISFKAYHDYVMGLVNAMRPGYTIDRIDNKGNYEPGNIRWVDQHTQNTNRRKSPKNKTGYTGVYLQGNSYISELRTHDKKYYFGSFLMVEEAVEARDRFIIDNGLTEYKLQVLTPVLLQAKSKEEAQGKWGKSMSGTEVWHINKDDSFEITEKKIEEMATEYAEQNYGGKDAQWDAYVSFIAGARAIIQLLNDK